MEKKNKLLEMRDGLIKIFEKFYEYDIAVALAQAHVFWHIQFVHELANEKAPAIFEEFEVRDIVEQHAVQRLRRASKAITLPQGAETTIFVDEIADFIVSSGECSVNEICVFATAIGSDEQSARAAMAKLLDMRRIRRVGGTATSLRARYTPYDAAPSEAAHT